MQIKGVNNFIKNLKGSQKIIGRGAERGLKKAGLFLLRESQKIVPVQTTNLRGSAFIRSFGSGTKTDVVIGYTAKYAAYVHEDLEKAHGTQFNIKYADLIATRGQRGKRRRKQGFMHRVESDPYFKRGEEQQAKFIERPARDNRDKLLNMIAAEIKKGLR